MGGAAAAAKADAEKEERNKKEAEEKKKKDEEDRIAKAEANAKELLAELEGLVKTAEDASENVDNTCLPLKEMGSALDDEEIMKIAATVHKQGRQAMAACSFCADFITNKRPIIQEAGTMQQESTQAIAALLPRIKAATRRTAEAFQKGKEHRTVVCKRTAAKRKATKNAAMFQKYATGADGLMSIKDVAAYAKGEFSLELPDENMKRIEDQIFPVDATGVGVESFYLLTKCVGIARDEVKGKEKVKKKKELEAFVATRKEELGKQIDEMLKELDGCEKDVKDAETDAQTLANQAGSLAADVLKEKAATVETKTEGAKAAVAKHRTKGMDIFAEANNTPELQAAMGVQLISLDMKLSGYEQRLTKATEMASSGKQLALYMSVSEYEGLWTEIIVKMRSYIEGEGKTIEDLFCTIAGSTDVQSVHTDQIYEYLKKHDPAIERPKIDKLFCRQVGSPKPEAKPEESEKKEEKKEEEKAAETKEGETKKAEAKPADKAEDEEEDDYVSKADLEAMTVPALKTLCKGKDEKVTGNKAELVERLSAKYEAAKKEREEKKEAAAKAKAEAEAAAAKEKEEAEAAAKKAEEEKKAAEAAAAMEKAAAATLQEQQKQEVSKEEFNRIVRMYYKVARQCVLSDNLLIEKSAQIRRMEVGEILEVFRGPCIDTSVGVYRLLAKAIKDATVGWATIAGNQGITFLVPGGRIFTTKVATPFVNDRMDIDGNTSGKIRDLQPGEFLEVIEWARTSQSALGLLRIQARAQSDGAVGWATVIAADGTVHLEAM